MLLERSTLVHQQLFRSEPLYLFPVDCFFLTLLTDLRSHPQREMYTRVLKGHIGIDRQVFPVGTPGCFLDIYAREHLWQVGKNFNHGWFL